MIGQTISHYKITEKLSEGGNGVVYKAEDLGLSCTVTPKFVPPQEEEHRERLLRKARVAATFDHPNVCTVYEVDYHGILATELVEGSHLAGGTRNGLPMSGFGHFLYGFSGRVRDFRPKPKKPARILFLKI